MQLVTAGVILSTAIYSQEAASAPATTPARSCCQHFGYTLATLPQNATMFPSHTGSRPQPPWLPSAPHSPSHSTHPHSHSHCAHSRSHSTHRHHSTHPHSHSHRTHSHSHCTHRHLQYCIITQEVPTRLEWVVAIKCVITGGRRGVTLGNGAGQMDIAHDNPKNPRWSQIMAASSPRRH